MEVLKQLAEALLSLSKPGTPFSQLEDANRPGTAPVDFSVRIWYRSDAEAYGRKFGPGTEQTTSDSTNERVMYTAR